VARSSFVRQLSSLLRLAADLAAPGAMAAALPLWDGVAVKNTVALARQHWDGMSVGTSVVRAGSRRQVLVGLLVGELLAAIALFASGAVPPVLVRSLQLFLRF
jgi:hypothetical protein